MRSGPSPTASPCANVAARTAKLGLSLAGMVAGMDGAGLRATLARSAAGEAIKTAARAGVTLFDSPEGGEPLLGATTDARFMLHISAVGPGPDQLEGRFSLARARLAHQNTPHLLLDGVRLLADDGDALWSAALRLGETGACTTLGIVVAPGGDAVGLAKRFKPEVMQVCSGLLDQRLIHSGALGEIAAAGIEVQIRTALLHGLLFLPREGLPPALAEAGPQVSRVRRMIAEAGADPLQAALAFALDRPEASGVIVEASSVGEVRAILAAASAPSPQLDWPALALDHPAALDAEAQLSRYAA